MVYSNTYSVFYMCTNVYLNSLTLFCRAKIRSVKMHEKNKRGKIYKRKRTIYYH